MDRPWVLLTIGGAPSELFLGSGLRDFTYHDIHHGAVDEVAFSMADPDGLFRSAWGIDEGTIVTALFGYQNALMMPAGTFAIDEAEARGGSEGDTATFRALAAFTSKDLRTDRSEAYDKMTLKAIVAKVAKRHGLDVVGNIPELKFERVTQDKESDLRFLTRLAEAWGFYFSVKGSSCVFVPRKDVDGAPPVEILDLVDGSPIKSYTLRTSTKGLYSKASVKYLHPKTQKVVTAELEDARVPSGDTLKVEERAETKAHAEKMCQARLAKANEKLGTGDFDLVGRPLLVAGQVVMLGLTFGKYAGRWLITSADHSFGADGYTTKINVRLL